MRESRIINKIYNNIDKIASKGFDNKSVYNVYIDDLISNKQYHILETVMELKYNILIKDYESVSIFKEKSWVKVLLHTNANIAKRIKKIFDRSDVYQIGLDIFKSSDNTQLGYIKEIDTIPNIDYLIQNENFAKIIKDKITILEVYRILDDGKIYITDSNKNLNPDSDLIDRYELAIKFLLNLS